MGERNPNRKRMATLIMASMNSLRRPRSTVAWLLLCCSLFLTGCGGGGGDDVVVSSNAPSPGGGGGNVPTPTARAWTRATSFAFQLQAPDLDQILAAGFDGVYLDIIDAYEFYEQQGDTLARGRMESLVADIATYARARSGGDFGVFPQNGEALVEDADYLQVITGLGKEDTYYGYDEDNVATPADATAEIERLAGLVVSAGKVVLNIDYTNVPSQIQDAHQRAAARGFLEYTAPRALDDLVVIPGLQSRP